MSELRPILGDDPTDDEKRLLDSARIDVPPQAGRRRALAAMALAAAVTTTAGTGGAAAATASAGMIMKWTALVAIGGAIALGGVGSLRPLVGLGHHVSAAPGPAPAAAHPGPPGAPLHSNADPAQSTSLEEPAQPAASDVRVQAAHPDEQAPGDSTPPVRATPSAPTRRPERKTEPDPAPGPPSLPASLPDRATAPAADDTLTAEVAALDEARRTLAGGDAAQALLSLDAYDRRFARRRLGPEAAVLRIEALIADGRLGQAHQLGDRLLASDPEGAYAQHVRSLLSRAAP